MNWKDRAFLLPLCEKTPESLAQGMNHQTIEI